MGKNFYDMTDDDLFKIGESLREISAAEDESWCELADRWRQEANRLDVLDLADDGVEIEEYSSWDDLFTAIAASAYRLALTRLAKEMGTTELALNEFLEEEGFPLELPGATIPQMPRETDVSTGMPKVQS